MAVLEIRRFDKRLEERFRAEGEMMDKRFDGVDNELKVLREGMKIILAKLA